MFKKLLALLKTHHHKHNGSPTYSYHPFETIINGKKTYCVSIYETRGCTKSNCNHKTTRIINVEEMGTQLGQNGLCAQYDRKGWTLC